jgi:23S rRNA A1618 N6-methylase RlmF
VSWSKEDRLEWQRGYRKRTGNQSTNKYEKSKKGFVMRLYRNMKSRVNGVQKLKYHLYEGKALIEKDEFYTWVLSNPKFHELFDKYVESGFNRKLSPSVDRVDSEKGYEIGNLEMVTMSENSRRGTLNRWRKRFENTTS